ncbi:hypothetical protein TNCV_3035791 [Trichonephila clavipes]|nr:hypothetical protein TNCV_3035791 [Trichonephila clavipes]
MYKRSSYNKVTLIADNTRLRPLNVPEGTEDDTVWENGDAETNSEFSSYNGRDESFSKRFAQMKHHSHASRSPSFDQSPSCHSAE